ncbi:MAG TPA: alpha/beta hydrolase [Nevskiaceae bacterium]|nr:alpha/beta hydrolase [Nevskiaceae bacterium]
MTAPSTPRPAPRAGSFSYEQYRLAYETFGEAGSPVVLVHGILLDSHCNRGLARELAAAGYQVHLLDLLGHGRSDRPARAHLHRSEFYARQVVALLDHLGIERAVIGGVSLGAITALQVALLAPRRVRALFLEMPVMEWSTPFAALLLTPIMLAARYGAPVYRPLTRLMARLPRPPADLAVTLMNVLSLEPEVVTAILHGVLVGPVAPTLSQRRALKMPALVIGHGGDRLHALRDAKALARQLPQARLLEAHSLLELRLRPQRLLPEILAFFHEVDGRARRHLHLASSRAEA